ncbi:hypothetical protein LG943_11070 [Streptomonospora sp. S1-112]|uniref:Uncharacterized protein n=1 Tax=Streptomonospora mangrovi TaxID=2883123 RepID=A0A9X3NQG7_9ACTN|nr:MULTISPECIES: hypothetical protein [Streptomonospora]MBX9388827.1 hypothetical protein [Streptomonospora nanhaiensis]MDA0564860.1 hypothetical protein [Streptomonospora mangrovi]
MLARRLAATLRARHAALRGDRGSYTTEIVIGITIVVAITAVVGPILTDTFAQAARDIDLGITK